MLFLMNDDVPCTMATWIQLTMAAPVNSYPSRNPPGGLIAATSSTFEPGTPAVFQGGAFQGAFATFNFAAPAPAAYSGTQGAAVSITTPGTATWHVQVSLLRRQGPKP